MKTSDHPNVQPGQRYTGWGKTWEVIRVAHGVVDAFNVDRPSNTIRWPIVKFRDQIFHDR